MSNSPLTLSYDLTAAYSGVSCIREVYYFHIASAYFIVIAGIGAIVTRVLRRYHTFHVWFGRLFIIGMLWTTGSATLIYNTGLPRPIIIFLLIMFITHTIGYFAIKIEQQRFHSLLLQRVDAYFATSLSKQKQQSVSDVMEAEALNMEKSLTWKERYFSLKALHGGCMVAAWYQMFGRAVVTNPFVHFDCWTYPVAKNGTEGHIEYLAANDPTYSIADNTSFVLMVTLPWVIAIPTVGLIWSYVEARISRKGYNSIPLLSDVIARTK